MANNWAIVIGINHYEFLDQSECLSCAVHDAERIKEFLCNQAGFDADHVLLCSDQSEPLGKRKIPTRPTRTILRSILLDELQDAERADNLWFFFSGHGMIGDDNHDYLMPCDGRSRDLEGTAIPVDFVIRRLLECRAKNIVMIMDMCRRSDGSKGNDDVGAQTAKAVEQKGIVTIFSCDRGQKSYEIKELQQGAFTYALLEGLATNKTPVELEKYLQDRVFEINRNYRKSNQKPIISLGSAQMSNVPLLQVTNKLFSKKESEIFDKKASVSSRVNRAIFVTPAIPGATEFSFEVTTIDSHGRETERYQEQSQYIVEELGNSVRLEMVLIPGGDFLMGSPGSERRLYPAEESPTHLVKVKPFLMGKHPITKAQWREVAVLPKVRRELQLRPSRQGSANHPIVQISWYDAIEFCDRLSEKTGHKYRLPSESEWEFSCRAGTTTPFHFGETLTSYFANYDGNIIYRFEQKSIHRGKLLATNSFPFANAFGLFDMHGNVWEWCLDQWHRNYNKAPTDGSAWVEAHNNLSKLSRVIRGGSWRNEPHLCRSAYRISNNIDDSSSNNIGFRIVREIII
jgi:formylglycine-generating enzyme required for sulfatase activity